MSLVEFTDAVGHLRFDPDTELDAVFLGIAQQTFDALRELVLVDHPIAKRGVIRLAWIFVAKPTVVHHKEFTTHRGNIAHHLVHALLVDVEINALPRIE